MTGPPLPSWFDTGTKVDTKIFHDRQWTHVYRALETGDIIEAEELLSSMDRLYTLERCSIRTHEVLNENSIYIRNLCDELVGFKIKAWEKLVWRATGRLPVLSSSDDRTET